MMSSLKSRLLLGLTAATSLVLFTAGVILYALIRAELLADFDAALANEAHSLATLVEEKDGRIQTEMAEHGVTKFQSITRPIYYEIWDREGRVIERSSSLGATELAQVGGTREQPEFRTIVLPGQQAGRMVGFRFTPYRDDALAASKSMPVLLHDSEATLVVARNTLELDHSLRRIGLLLIGVFGGAVVVSLLVAAPIVRASLHPLQRTSRRIKSLGTRALSERLDSRDAPNEIRSVIDCLNGLLDQLRDAFQREQAFSANVAHELRTPLAGLRCTIEVTLSQPRESSDYRRSLNGCLAICQAMESLTENLFVLARFDAGKCKPRSEAVTMTKVLHETWLPLATRAQSRGLRVSWRLEAEVQFETDPDLLSLIFRNLLDNAISYADDNGELKICSKANGTQATVTFTNSAAGLSDDLSQLAFDRFWRADSSRSDIGQHAGLGLSLCREAIRVLGGELVIATDRTSFTACLSLQIPAKRKWSPG